MIPLPASAADGGSPDAGYLRALRQQRRRGQTRLQSAAWLSLALTGWIATTLLVTVGLFGIAFFLLGNATLLGMMRQLELFAAHYGSATADVRASFDVWLCRASLLLFFGVGFFRRSSLLAIFDPMEAQRG